MHRFPLFALAALFAAAAGSYAQDPPAEPPLESYLSPYSFTMATPPDPAEGFGGAGGGGQVEPAAYADRYLTRLTLRSGISPLGTGGQVATNLPWHMDARFIGNYTNFDWKLNESGFYVILNIGMANTGAFLDYYPWKSLRFSPGYLYYNTNRVKADLTVQDVAATFTINNVTYATDPGNPIHGTGRLQLGGAGFMATTGWGHIVRRDEKHWSFPFEAGAAFINTPSVTFNLLGDVCNLPRTDCRPAEQFPGFANNLNQQVASWNKRVSPFHIYPLLEGGVSYTFRFRR